MRTGRRVGSAAMAAEELTMSHLALSKPAEVGGAEAGLEGEGQTGVKPHIQIPGVITGVITGVIRARGQPCSPAEALSHLNHLPKMWHGTCSRLEPRYCPAAMYSSRACKESTSLPSSACICQQKHIALQLSR